MLRTCLGFLDYSEWEGIWVAIDIQKVDTERDLLGEGPLWDPQDGVLYWIDSNGCHIRRLDPISGEVQNWPVLEQIGSMALRESGGAVIALKSGFHFFDFGTGIATPIIDPEPGEERTRFNDGKVDRQGRFLAGSMDMPGNNDLRGSFYRLDPDLKVSKLRENIGVSNGPCFSPDGTTFYFADSSRQMIWAYDYDGETGDVSNMRTFIDLEPFDAVPDGATVDAAGCLWSALVTRGQIGCFSPAGELMRTVDVPSDHPSSVMFGGADLDVLYVTSIWEWRQVKTENEVDGHLIAIHGLEATGLPERRFAG